MPILFDNAGSCTCIAVMHISQKWVCDHTKRRENCLCHKVDKEEMKKRTCLDALEHTLGCCNGGINVCICVCEGCEASLELRRHTGKKQKILQQHRETSAARLKQELVLCAGTTKPTSRSPSARLGSQLTWLGAR
jgi:hypothetical protein